ncbi:PXA domain-containing protein [Lactarius pseudohatsudake]|nr:PXA domain-containing protein [Lactarius pseudohatsudake]
MAISPTVTVQTVQTAPSITSSKLTAQGHSTTSLTKRLLFPHLDPSSPLPPLLQTSSVYPPLDTELYDLIALALRAYINPWWTRISRYDKQLLVEITRTLSSVFRALEARVLAADLSPLVYHRLPVLLTQHCVDYRTASRKLGSSYAAAGSASLPMLFHGPAAALYVRAAIDVVLKACLSPEDWDAEAERYLLREIVVKTICVDVAPRITQPWFLHSTLLNLLGPAELPLRPPDPPPSRLNTNSSAFPSLHTIIVLFLSAVQSISSTALSVIHVYKQTVNTIKRVHNSPHTPAARTAPYVSEDDVRPPASASPPETPSTPSFPTPSDSVVASLASQPINAGTSSSPTRTTTVSAAPSSHSASPPHLARPSLLLIGELLSLRSRFTGSALLFLCDALIGAFASFLDRLLPLLLYTSFLTPVQVTGLVSAAKRALFPNGYPAQSPPDPTPEEQAVLRSELVRRLAQTIPAPLVPLLLGPTPSVRELRLSALLDPFDEQACNAHLFMLIFDLLLLALFPEMAVGATDIGGTSSQ